MAFGPQHQLPPLVGSIRHSNRRCAKCGEWSEALRLLERMEALAETGCRAPVSAFVYNTAMAAVRRFLLCSDATSSGACCSYAVGSSSPPPNGGLSFLYISDYRDFVVEGGVRP